MHNTHTTRNVCAYISANFIPGHEKISYGPLFSERTSARWSGLRTIFQSLLMSYDDAATLRDRFAHAREGVVEMFSHQRRPGQTYQGFVKARRRLTTAVAAPLQRHLQHQHQKLAGPFWQQDGWIPFAGDGSRFEMPRTKENEDAFGCAGRNKTGPQLLLTVLYHMGTGLPWAWQCGPGTDSERYHLRWMMDTLPPKALLVLDAGFTGYELMCDLDRCGIRFLIRAGANMTFLRDLGLEVEQRGDIVWLWPGTHRRRPPLRLRLIQLEVISPETGQVESMCLVTNVMDHHQLSDEQAEWFYQQRWGVEIYQSYYLHCHNVYYVSGLGLGCFSSAA